MFKSHVTITDEFYFRGLRNSKPPNLYFFSRPSVLKDNVYPVSSGHLWPETSRMNGINKLRWVLFFCNLLK